MKIQDFTLSERSQGLAIASAGYETRSSALLRAGYLHEPGIALVYSPTPLSDQHDRNIALFEREGWRLRSVQDGMSLLSQHLIEGVDQVTVDYSSMPRKVLADIVNRLAMSPHPVEGRFVYSEPTFDSSKAAALKDVNLTAGPVSPAFAGDARPLSAPIGLILGLGMELHRGLGVVELLEPERTWAMVADSTDTSFSDAATANHAALFGEVDSVSLLSYPLSSVSRSYAMLFSLVSSASQKYRVVLVPSGPKPLALAAMIASLDVPGPRPALWRVGSLSRYEPSDVLESGEAVAVQINFS